MKPKFRVWDKIHKCMLPSFDNWIDADGNYWTTPSKSHDTPHTEIEKYEAVELMQWTGFFDKNGKEIYEGDIVKGWEGNLFKITWCRAGCDSNLGFWPMDFKQEYHSWESEEYEVIGNKFEHPELIK